MSYSKAFFIRLISVVYLSFYVGPFAHAQTGGPAVSVTANSSSLGTYDIYELTLTNTGVYSNPWQDVIITATFTSPSGIIYKVGGFYYDVNTWKVRFSPNMAGSWSWTANFSTSAGTAGNNGSFTVTSSGNRGFIRIDRVNTTRFYAEGDNGVFHIVGWNDGIWGNGYAAPNLSWCLDVNCKSLTSQQYFTTMASAGFNLFRHGPGNSTVYSDGTSNIYCAASNLDIGGTGANKYSITSMKQEDEVYATSHPLGIHHLLTLTAIPAYFLTSAMPTSGDRWTSWANYVQYMINRFGAYVDIWEISNENTISTNPSATRDISPAVVDATSALIRQLDPYGHPISVSYPWPGGPHPGIDLTDEHAYQNSPTLTLDEAYTTSTYSSKTYFAAYPGQPLIFGETGNQAPLLNDDGTGERFRDSLYSMFFSGAYPVWWMCDWTTTGGGGPSNIYIGPLERQASLGFSQNFVDFDAAAAAMSAQGSSNIRAYVMGSPKDVGWLYSQQDADHLSGQRRDNSVHSSGG